MTTLSQAALIKAQQVYASLRSVKPELSNFFFNVGVEFGRKQALEDAIAICKVHATPKMRVSDYAEGYNQSAEVCMEELKGLLV